MKVTKRKTAATLLAATAILLLAYGVGAWSPKCKYAFGGMWTYTSDVDVVVVTESPVDIVGKRESVGTGTVLNDDPTLYGCASWSLCHMESVSTGKYTFETRAILYGMSADNQIVLMIPFGGTGTWIDQDHRELDFWSTIYTSADDQDGDGWPDEGTTPMMVNRWTYMAERMSMFPEPSP